MARFFSAVLVLLLFAAFSQGQTPTPSPPASGLPPSNLQGDTAILAKLNTPLNLQKCAVNDSVEAEVSKDLKQGKDVILKKGSIISGYVSAVSTPNSSQPDNLVEIVINKVRPKGGQDQSVAMIIRALAPEVNVTTNSTIPGGRGMPGAVDKVGASGGDMAETGNIDPLDASSVGVAHIPGLQLGRRKTSSGMQSTVLAWTTNPATLKKNSQMVLLVVSQ